MDSITKRDRRMLGDILLSMRKAQTFIKRDTTFVCKKSDLSAGDDTFLNKKGVSLVSINKEIGSDLCYLDNAIRSLENFLIED